MKLIVQPADGAGPVLQAIARARSSIDITIFRLDMADVLDALAAAVERGVLVRALVAHTNKGDEKGLRRLERDLLAIGVTVARSADDLVRYHGKMMIVDARSVHVYGFNFTRLDINKSRSFGVVSTSRPTVLQARRLFDADCTRQPYTADDPRLVISPVNARARLAAFIRGARRQLLIYDGNLCDPQMLKLLSERQKKGVDVRIIGATSGRGALPAEPFAGRRLHVRAIIRDGARAFIGSQSLRALELDRRREIGLFVVEGPVVKRLVEVFEQDWAETAAGKAAAALAEATAVARTAAEAAKAAASKVEELTGGSEQAAKDALSEAETLARQARDAARDAEAAASRLAKGDPQTPTATVMPVNGKPTRVPSVKDAVAAAKAAAKEAIGVVKEAGKDAAGNGTASA